MINFKSRTACGSDCTTGYDVILDKEYTIKDFINAVLTERPYLWGSINIEYDTLQQLKCNYKYGKIIDSTIPSLMEDSTIESVHALGGYSAMEIFVTIKSPEPVNKKMYEYMVVYTCSTSTGRCMLLTDKPIDSFERLEEIDVGVRNILGKGGFNAIVIDFKLLREIEADGSQVGGTKWSLTIK